VRPAYLHRFGVRG